VVRWTSAPGALADAAAADVDVEPPAPPSLF
jgi:hypothetical protein